MTISKFCAAVLLPMLAACASMGTNFDEGRVPELHAGMSKSEVIGIMGQPNGESHAGADIDILTWLHSSANAFGGAKAKLISIQFDRRGSMVRIANSSHVDQN